MKNNIRLLLSEAQKKMSGYAVLLNFHFLNLCIKAEPAALLSINVTLNGEDVNLEDLADISLETEYQFEVIPKDPSLIFTIGKGFKEAHPEFKVEEKANDPDNPEERTLYFTMPEVDDDRYKACNDFIDLVYEECATKVDITNTTYTTRILKECIGMEIEDIDEIKEEMKATYDQHTKICREYKEAKIKEVEEAYQKYKENEKNKEAAATEIKQAQSEDLGYQMKMEMPEAKAPEMKMPEMEIPKVEIPEMEIPEMEIPKVEIPEMEIPDIKIP